MPGILARRSCALVYFALAGVAVIDKLIGIAESRILGGKSRTRVCDNKVNVGGKQGRRKCMHCNNYEVLLAEMMKQLISGRD